MPEETHFSQKQFEAMAQVFKDLVFPHGPNALLNDGTVRPTMASALPTIPVNWSSTLPFNKDNKADGATEIFTGQTANTGDRPDSTCETPAKPGNFKVCKQLLPFGMYHKGTESVNVAKTGTRKNWADMNRQFINPPNLSGNPFMPEVVRLNPQAINTPLGKKMLEFGNAAILDWAIIAWQGVAGATNLAEWIDQPNGFASLVKTGYQDAPTSVLCPAADSYVVSFNALIGADFVAELSNAARVAKETASLVSMPTTMWDLVVNPRLRYSIIDNWACNYHTARCDPDETNGRRINTETVTRLRDEMLRGNYLLIDGEQWPLRIDWGIPVAQDETTGNWTGDVFGMPTYWDGTPLTYWEINPYDNSETAEFVNNPRSSSRVINDGLYLETYVNLRTCEEFQYNARPRPRVDYPFLAFRVDDVIVPNSTPFRSPFHDDPYYVNGGQYIRA